VKFQTKARPIIRPTISSKLRKGRSDERQARCVVDMDRADDRLDRAAFSDRQVLFPLSFWESHLQCTVESTFREFVSLSGLPLMMLGAGTLIG
jgi:hypothetical protein